MSFSIVNSLIVLIIFQCFFCTLFLFNSKKGKTVSNNILGVFLLILGVQFFTIFIEEAGWLDFKNYYLPVKFLYGPVIYWYTKSIIIKEFKFQSKDAIHLLPFLLSFLLILDILTLNEAHIILTVQISIFYYLIASMRYTRIHNRVLMDTRSNIDKISLVWLNQLLIFFMIIMTFDLLYHSFGFTIEFENTSIFYVLQLLVILSLVSTVVLKGLHYPELFSGITEEEISISMKSASQKYSSSNLSENDLTLYKEKIVDALKDKTLYLNPELSLGDLADEVDLSSRNLSYVINSQFQMNFADLINTYRIEAAVKIFEESQDPKQTILEVIYEVGFNSKSSFYNSFKKVIGKTPKEFKNDLKQNIQD